jgi:hypothetical protein
LVAVPPLVLLLELAVLGISDALMRFLVDEIRRYMGDGEVPDGTAPIRRATIPWGSSASGIACKR